MHDTKTWRHGDGDDVKSKLHLRACMSGPRRQQMSAINISAISSMRNGKWTCCRSLSTLWAVNSDPVFFFFRFWFIANHFKLADFNETPLNYHSTTSNGRLNAFHLNLNIENKCCDGWRLWRALRIRLSARSWLRHEQTSGRFHWTLNAMRANC